MCMQNFIKMYQTVQEVAPVSLFFRIWTAAKLRPIPNVIWQSHGLHLVNINVYAKFHHTIPHSLRDRAISTFSDWSSAKPRPMQMSFRNLLDQILSISMLTQKFIKIFHSVQETGPFSLFQNLALGKTSTDDISHFAISWARSCQYQFVCKILWKYSKQFKSFHILQNLNLGKTSTNPNCHLKILWAASYQYQCVCKLSSHIPLSSFF